jgi:plastocyanin
LVAGRLIQNQTDLGNAIKPFYGEEAGETLTGLLEEHIQGAVELLSAAKAGDTAAVETASAAWDENGAAIAEFLSSANPDNWPLADLQAGMQMHLDLTLEEATARLEGDFGADIAAYDKVHDHILELSGLLSDGIVAQFPDEAAQVTVVTATGAPTEAATAGPTSAQTSAATQAATTAATAARTTAPTQAATTAATATTRPTTAFMTLQDFEFVPPQITIAAGTTVVFLSKSAAGVCHGPYSSFPDSQDPSGMFDSGNLFDGQQYSFKFNQPGTVTVRCGCHPFMVGTIIVTP